MAPAVILSQINPDRDKILQSSGNNFYEESQIFSSRIISAPIDSFNNSMKLEIHQGTESHIFPNHLQAGAIWHTDEIAYRDEFQSLSYSANMSGVDADALLNTQLTVLGFPSLVNYQKYLKVSLRLDSTSQHLFQRTRHDNTRAQTLGILSSLVHPVLPFKPCPGLQKLLKQVRRRQLRLAVALPEVVVRRETKLTRLETDRAHARALSDSFERHVRLFLRISNVANA